MLIHLLFIFVQLKEYPVGGCRLKLSALDLSNNSLSGLPPELGTNSPLPAFFYLCFFFHFWEYLNLALLMSNPQIFFSIQFVLFLKSNNSPLIVKTWISSMGLNVVRIYLVGGGGGVMKNRISIHFFLFKGPSTPPASFWCYSQELNLRPLEGLCHCTKPVV